MKSITFRTSYRRFLGFLLSRRVQRCVCIFLVLLAVLILIYRYTQSSVYKIYYRPSGIDFRVPSAHTKPDMDGHYFLLVIVTSTPSARARRDLIRSTWGDANNTDITVRWKLVFNLGQSSSNEINSQVVTEASLFNDVFMGEFTDTYMNLVLKVFAAFSWANKIDCDYILKADEDVYINLPQLVTWLKRPGVPDSLYGGALAKNTGVYRYPWHKHFISYKTYKSDKLHTYCRGPFYILSHNVLSSIIQREVFRDVFPIEDAYVGLLVKRLGVEPLQLPGCVWERERNLGTVLCDLLSFVCFGDSLSAANINHIHKKYLELEKINRTVAMKICHLNQL